MKIDASLICHPGKLREKNEDNFCFFGLTLQGFGCEGGFASKKTSTDKMSFYAVFDGMGGMSAGDKASAIAAQTARNACFSAKVKDFDATAFMREICDRANAEICREMQTEVKRRMGSTAAMLCLQNNQFYICNIGDSPIYMLRGGSLTAIYEEHNERKMYEQLGGKGSGEGKKFKLTQHLGIFAEEMAIEPYFAAGTLAFGDKIILCSDGLTDMVSEQEIAQTLMAARSSEEAAKNLFYKALDNGGKDNITIAVIAAV